MSSTNEGMERWEENTPTTLTNGYKCLCSIKQFLIYD